MMEIDKAFVSEDINKILIPTLVTTFGVLCDVEMCHQLVVPWLKTGSKTKLIEF